MPGRLIGDLVFRLIALIFQPVGFWVGVAPVVWLLILGVTTTGLVKGFTRRNRDFDHDQTSDDR